MALFPRLPFPSLLPLFVAGALALGLGATCGACGTLRAISFVHGDERGPNDQFNATTMIQVTCSEPNEAEVHSSDPVGDAIINAFLPRTTHVYRGTGVMLSSQRALTNVHVVSCDEVLGARLEHIDIDIGHGGPHRATIEVLLPGHDIARLVLDSPFVLPDGIELSPPRIGDEPGLGDLVCASTAVPRWSYKCARIQPKESDPNVKGSLEFGPVQVEHGNSGSGVYDSDGRLIGLLYALSPCEAGLPCLGVITPIDSSMKYLTQ